MRRISYLSIALLVGLAATGVDAQNARPQFRPAVLVSGPDSLINRIDAQALFAAGQRDGAVMFSARATKEGRLTETRTYHGTPGSDKLAAEVLKRLPDTKIGVPIFNYQPVDTVLYGTVVFAVANDKPHIRIFLNQDAAELRDQSDFIGPHPVYGGEPAFSGLHPPEAGGTAPGVGLVGISLKGDATGNLQQLHALNEDPPLLGFGGAAESDLKGAKFIPAFRNGDAEACETMLALCYPKS